MAHKKKFSGPVPAGNQQHGGPPGAQDQAGEKDPTQLGGSPSHEEDSKRRLGDFTGTGEHSIQQPGGHNDANH